MTVRLVCVVHRPLRMFGFSFCHFLYPKIYLISCVCSACMCVYVPHACLLQGRRVWEYLGHHPLQEQSMLPTAEPSLQPPPRPLYLRELWIFPTVSALEALPLMSPGTHHSLLHSPRQPKPLLTIRLTTWYMTQPPDFIHKSYCDSRKHSNNFEWFTLMPVPSQQWYSSCLKWSFP